MVPIHLTRKHRTGLVRVSTDSDDSFDFLSQKFVQVLGAMTRNINADLLHYFDRLRVNVTGRLGPGALNVKQTCCTRKMPSAMWLRQELPVQRMRTVGLNSDVSMK
jgi:hypothetical protein